MVSKKVENSDPELKRLGFVRAIAINAAVCLSNLYGCAKQNSGPLKSRAVTVENSVAAVVGPVYEKFKSVPDRVLVFLDKKVDEAANRFIACAPTIARTVAIQASFVVQKTLQIVQSIVQEAKVSGPHAAINHAGTASKQWAMRQLAVAWYGVHKYPPLHFVAQMTLPTAVHCSEKYNNLVKQMTTNGCAAFNYFPLVPVEDMAKAYKQVEAAAAKNDDAAASSE